LVKQKLKDANQNAQRMEKTVQGISQIKSQGEVVSQDAEAILRAAVKETDEAKAKVNTLRERGSNLRTSLEKLKTLANGAVDETQTRSKLAELEKERADLIAATAEKPVDAALIRPALRSAEQAVTDSTVELGRIDYDINDLKAALEKAQQHDICPTCGQSTVEVRKTLVAELRKQITLAEPKRTAAFQKVIEATSIRGKVQADLDAVESSDKKFNQMQERLGHVLHEQIELQRKIDSNSKAVEAGVNIPDVEKQLAELRTQFIAAEQARDQKLKVEQDADAQYRRLLKERAETASRTQAITDAQAARAEAAVLKQAVDLVLSLQAELVKKTVYPIIESANRLCAGVLEHPLAYRDGEIGMAKPNGFITKTLSGTERALTRCAVSLALAAESPLKIVILDEMGRLSARNKQRVLENIADLIHEGAIDQAILVDTDAADYIRSEDGLDYDFKIIEV
jgi:chromosome segregation ATPase